ncbi:hypothetical protein N341_02404, partial [Tyto alba]
YQQWIVYGVQNAMPKAINWSKLYDIRQEKKESPTAFLERLKESISKYTDMQPEAEETKAQLAFIFLGHSQEDIMRKLQKLEGRELRYLDRLLEVAWKIYNNGEKENEVRKQRKQKQ